MAKALRLSPEGEPLRLALFGEPLSHSLSPRLQQAHATWLGRALEYHLLSSSAEGLQGALERARRLGVRGANVTAPHKALALRACDRLSETAMALGVVNTLTWSESGLEGDNTDLAGVRLSLSTLISSFASSPEAMRLRLIGSGGSARPALWAALELGITRLELVSRSLERAQALRRWTLAKHPAAASGSLQLTALSAESPHLTQVTPELCVLATPPLTARALNELCGAPSATEPRALLDLNYAERAQVSAYWARQRGAQHMDGGLMLAEQGRRSFERWTGALPPLATSKAALTS